MIVVAGATGTGKSGVALELAQALRPRGEILCADSITLFQDCDIGSAKPSTADQSLVPHHLLDVAKVDETFTAADFVRHAEAALEKIKSHGATPLVAGGAGFYLRAFLQGMTDQEGSTEESNKVKAALEARLAAEGAAALHEEVLRLDPESTIHPQDHYRIVRALQAMQLTGRPWTALNAEARARPPKHPEALYYVLHIPKEELQKNIESRTEAMLRQGLVDEVKTLVEKFSAQAKPLRSVGYLEVLTYLGLAPEEEAIKNLDELKARITRNTLRLAKSQLTWFRGEKRAKWIEAQKTKELAPLLRSELEKNGITCS